jgi:hypothetical protein
VRHPNLFIVGAPKCGTTALHSYLGQHPEVFMSAYKEPHHFGQDLDPRYYVRDRQQYLELFTAASTESRVGESSVFYLYSRTAASEIKAAFPESDIIVMLRNPIDMMYSLHSEMFYQAKESEPDFATALALEEERKKGILLANVYNPTVLYYREVARYHLQLRRYLDQFGAEHVRVIIYDDFRRDVQRTYRETCEFLGVDPDFVPDFKILNANHYVRYLGLRRFLRQPPGLLRKAVKAMLPHQAARQALKDRIQEINTTFRPRPPLPVELRRRLEQDFLPEVTALSELLGRDLTHWCRESQSASSPPAVYSA